MARIAFISGSGFYELEAASRTIRRVDTPFGTTDVTFGEVGRHTVLFVSRHGAGHERLSHQVDHRAHLWALKELSAGAIVGSTAVGVLDPSVSLGIPIIFDDLYFPTNRMPDGSLATIFTEPGDPRRGHWIPATPFSPALRRLLLDAARAIDCDIVERGCYVHADGPRFNTRPELAALRAAGGTAVSQTCGPEVVLAGELEVPYALVGFGVNYAPDIAVSPSNEKQLATLLRRHGDVVGRLLKATLERTPADAVFPLDTGTVYRFEK